MSFQLFALLLDQSIPDPPTTATTYEVKQVPFLDPLVQTSLKFGLTIAFNFNQSKNLVKMRRDKTILH